MLRIKKCKIASSFQICWRFCSRMKTAWETAKKMMIFHEGYFLPFLGCFSNSIPPRAKPLTVSESAHNSKSFDTNLAIFCGIWGEAGNARNDYFRDFGTFKTASNEAKKYDNMCIKRFVSTNRIHIWMQKKPWMKHGEIFFLLKMQSFYLMKLLYKLLRTGATLGFHHFIKKSKPMILYMLL